MKSTCLSQLGSIVWISTVNGVRYLCHADFTKWVSEFLYFPSVNPLHIDHQQLLKSTRECTFTTCMSSHSLQPQHINVFNMWNGLNKSKKTYQIIFNYFRGPTHTCVVIISTKYHNSRKATLKRFYIKDQQSPISKNLFFLNFPTFGRICCTPSI